MRFAVPCAEGELCLHFGHCQFFAIIDVDDQSKKIVSSEEIVPPPHEPGLLPRWLAERKVTHIIAGGMGQRAQSLFEENKIQVVVGATGGSAQELVLAWLGGNLKTGANACDH